MGLLGSLTVRGVVVLALALVGMVLLFSVAMWVGTLSGVEAAMMTNLESADLVGATMLDCDAEGRVCRRDVYRFGSDFRRKNGRRRKGGCRGVVCTRLLLLIKVSSSE